MNSMLRVAFLTLLLMSTAGAAEVDKLVEAGNRLWQMAAWNARR